MHLTQVCRCPRIEHPFLLSQGKRRKQDWKRNTQDMICFHVGSSAHNATAQFTDPDSFKGKYRQTVETLTSSLFLPGVPCSVSKVCEKVKNIGRPLVPFLEDLFYFYCKVRYIEKRDREEDILCND